MIDYSETRKNVYANIENDKTEIRVAPNKTKQNIQYTQYNLNSLVF